MLMSSVKKKLFSLLRNSFHVDVYRRNSHPWGEEQMWSDLRRLIVYASQKGGPNVAIDVGAYRGETVKRILQSHDFQSIHAIEPHPGSYAHLRERFANSSNVRIHNCAVSDVPGTVLLHLTKSEQSNSILMPVQTTGISEHERIGEILVETCTLDALARTNGIERVRIVKIDVQGAELNVLRGAGHLLIERRIDIIVCEVEFIELYEKQPLFADLLKFVSGYEFELYGIYSPRPNMLGQLAWADGIFVQKAILESLALEKR